MNDWENIAYDTQRLKVFGGWIVAVTYSTSYFIRLTEATKRLAMCFVPDPQHEWELK